MWAGQDPHHHSKPSERQAPQQQTRLELTSLDSVVQGYFEAGLAPSTRKTYPYQSGINCFYKFCTTYQIPTPLPVTQSTLCYFISPLAKDRLAYSTIKSYLSAVRYIHILHNLPEPRSIPMPKLSLVELGIRKSSYKSTPRLPIGPDILCQIRALWSPSADHQETIMLWAVCTTCFFGFFRLGELVANSQLEGQNSLQFNDLAIDSATSPSMLEIHLRHSKTDRFGSGVSIFLGRSFNDLCPVSAMLAFLAVRGGGGDGPLFCDLDGSPLTKNRVVSKVRLVLQTVGLDDKAYAGHSFRIGAATTAAERGLEDSLIKALGRWESDAFQLYIRTPREKLTAITQILSS